MEVVNPEIIVPPQNIRRQVTCSGCGIRGHTRRSNLCPQNIQNGGIVQAVAAPQNGGQIIPGGEGIIQDGALEGMGVLGEALNFIGALEGPDNDHPEDLQAVDQIPELVEGDEYLEWPEVPMNPLQPGVAAQDANVPAFVNPLRHGRPNAGNLINMHLVNEADYAQLFIDDAVVLSTWVEQTNLFGRLYMPGWRVGGINRWDTNLTEFKAFLALIILTGVMPWANRDEMYRRGNREVAFVHGIMSRPRFNRLMIAWHYANVDHYRVMNPQEQALFRRQHPFYQVEDLVAVLQARFRRYYNPGQLVDIDEQCIPWKGRHRCRCYNPKKPVKWHFKVFALNDAGSGYCSNFYLYEGKAEQRPPGIDATVYPFFKLFTSPGDGGGEDPDQYRNRNHVLATDNWFTSIPAVDLVLESGNHCLGTVKANRGGLSYIHLYNKTMTSIDIYDKFYF